jgi:membrane protease YdiL (CAAX protease family)
MTLSLSWNEDNLAPVVSIFSTTILFLIYHFTGWSKQFIRKFAQDDTQLKIVLFRRALGAVSFGIIPALMIILVFQGNFAAFGLSLKHFSESLIWIAGLGFLIIPMNYFAARKPANLEQYPQIRKKEWTTGLILTSAISWIIYLTGYEFMFRGWLLFGTAGYTGIWPAIALNTAIYALVHVPKGLNEAAGAIPLGFVLCIATISTGTIWVALLTHIMLALSNEWFSIKYHHEMVILH